MQNLFKGYVPTKDKKCLMPFKNKTSAELQTHEQVYYLPEYAGIIDDKVVLIDVDDGPQAEKLLDIIDDLHCNCRVYRTTRGKHFFFMNVTADGGYILDKCGTGKQLACGITADIKVGCKNSYSILKHNGSPRFIEYDIEGNEEYEPLPVWLRPIGTKIEFLNMTAGDGRNQALFNYILTLQSNGFSMDEARETLRIINKYILADPLDERELATLSRDEAFQKPAFFNGTTFLFDKFARFIMANEHVIKINNILHVYKNGIYIDGWSRIESQMIKHIPTLSRIKRAEVLAYLNLLIENNSTSDYANYIAFKNGVYNIETNQLEDFSPDKIITNKIPHEYDPTAYSELMDRTLNKLACNDMAIRALLEECVGYCFYRRNEMRKSFILTGEKENGKSTFLSIVEALLGQNNTSALDLKELGDRFKTAELVNKLANIGDDIGDEFIPNPAVFKKLSSGNPITVERKGQDPFDFSNYAKLLFSANDIPRIKDKSGAVVSRLVIIPFNARFSPSDADYDPYIKYKLIQEEPLQYLIRLGIDGLRRVLLRRQFTSSEVVEQALEEYEENNNPILLFFKSDTPIEYEPTNVVYRKYTEFCLANSFTPMSNIEFSKQIRKHLHLEIVQKRLNGKACRIFINKEKEGATCE